MLDGRAEWVSAVLNSVCPWQDTPIQLQVAAGLSTCNMVIFVENLVTFERLRERIPSGSAMIFSSGFKAAAERIPAGKVSWYFEPSTPPDILPTLKSVLFDNARQPAVTFFGDLDFSGMVILKRLRQRWPNLTAWQAGYSELLLLLKAGRGHPPESADKAEQLDPESTGCAYADGVLLPALRAHKTFVDQEAMSLRFSKTMDLRAGDLRKAPSLGGLPRADTRRSHRAAEDGAHIRCLDPGKAPSEPQFGYSFPNPACNVDPCQRECIGERKISRRSSNDEVQVQESQSREKFDSALTRIRHDIKARLVRSEERRVGKECW